MPIYEYRCKNGHTLEVMQRMSDDPLTDCTTCKAPVQRVFHPVAVHFKGSGFYSTDYGKQSKSGDESKGKGGEDAKSGAGKEGSGDNSTGKGESSSDGTKDSGPKKPEKKADPAKS